MLQDGPATIEQTLQRLLKAIVEPLLRFTHFCLWETENNLAFFSPKSVEYLLQYK